MTGNLTKEIFSYMILVTMKKSLKKLKKQCETWEKVAEKIGITPRHLLNIRKDEHVGRFLANHIKALAK